MAISDSLQLARKKAKRRLLDKVKVSISKQTGLFSKCLWLMSFLRVKLTSKKNICKGPFTQAIFVAQLNAIFVALKLQLQYRTCKRAAISARF